MTITTLVVAPPRALLADYMGTDYYEGEDYSTFQHRLGQCYFLAARGVIETLEDGILVHGTIHGRGSYQGRPHVRIGHAWVILSTEPGQARQVWEPVTGDVYHLRDWYGYARAREERLYSEEQARIQMLRTGHYGRWHESPYP